jgi:hypothetical protein
MVKRTKITADLILDLYKEAKKTTGLKKENIMKKVIYLSQHLNEYVALEKIPVQ